MIHEDFTGEDKEELTNVIPSEGPLDSGLAELEHSDNEMLKNIVAAILSEEPRLIFLDQRFLYNL